MTDLALDLPLRLTDSARPLERAAVGLRGALCDWRLTLLAVLVMSGAVRLINLDHSSLNHAEAARVNAAWSTTWDNVRWFPPAQYALLWTVRHVTSGHEFVMRLPSALAGLACVMVVFLFTRKYFGAWAGVCAAALAAGHAELVAHSRIVKEFSIETLVSALLFWAGFEACRAVERQALRRFVVVAGLGAALTYTWSLMVAAWTPVIAFQFLRRRESRRQHLLMLVRAAAVIVVFYVLWYLWFFDCYNRQGASHDYGVIRGAWPVDYQMATLVAWFVRQTYGAAQFVMGIGDLYSPINWLIGGYIILLLAAAWREVCQKAAPLMWALGSVIAVAALAGAIRAWPYGRFHTLIFLVPPICVIGGVGLKVLVERIRLPLPVLALAAVCLLNPAARAVKNTVIFPEESEHLRPILKYVERHAAAGDGIFTYYAGNHAVKYYWQRDDVPVLLQPTDDRDQITLFSARFDEFATKHERVWFVFTHNWRDEQVEWIEHLKARYPLLDHVENPTASVHLFDTGPAVIPADAG